MKWKDFPRETKMTTNTGIVQNREVNLGMIVFTPGSSGNREQLEYYVNKGYDGVLIQTEGFLPFNTRLVDPVYAYFDQKGILRYRSKHLETVKTEDQLVKPVEYKLVPPIKRADLELKYYEQNGNRSLLNVEELQFELSGTGKDKYQLKPSENITLDALIRAQQKGFPIFLLQEPWSSYEYQARIKQLSAEGIVELPAKADKYWGVFRGLQTIIANAKAKTQTPEARYNRIKAEAQRVFSGNDYHDKPPFVELMIRPELKELADALPKDCGSIVVDCGHIDAPNFFPTSADQLTLEEGAILVKYLKLQGHKDVKLNILVNEMYLAEQLGASEARKAIRGLRKDAKRTGRHFLIDRAYMRLLDGYGITKDEIATQFEGILAYQCRQDLETHQKGQSKFQTPMVEDENGVCSVETFDDGIQFKRKLYSPANAPMCSGISAKLNQALTANGAGTIIYLRDIKHECGIRSGAMAGRNVYGLDTPMQVVFYAETKLKRVEVFDAQRL